jgi:hypothetical protein
VDFIKICITPISIIITFLGFLYTATGSITAINSDSFWACLEYYNNAFNALGSLAGIVVYKVAVWLIGRMVLVLFLGYIFSIPVQIASYLILQFLVYNIRIIFNIIPNYGVHYIVVRNISLKIKKMGIRAADL